MKKEQEINKSPEGLPEKPVEEVLLSPEEEKFEAQTKAAEKEEKEKAEFLGGMQKDEQEMATGILRKIGEASPTLKKGIMILATAGLLLSAAALKPGEAEAFSISVSRGYHSVRTVMPYHVHERVDYAREAANRECQEAYRDYENRVEMIQRAYEQGKYDIMTGRAPGTADDYGKQNAYRELKQWRENEMAKARHDWQLKAWAIEEAYRMKSGHYRGR